MKCKYALVSAAGALLFSPGLFSQSFTIGGKAGISIPNIRGNTEQSKGYTSREGAYFGLLVNKKISKYFSLQAEVNYSPQGGQRNKMQPVPADQFSGIEMPPGTQLYADFRNKTILNYIEIPLVGQLDWKRLIKDEDTGLGINKCLYAAKHTGADDKILAGIELDSLRNMYGHRSKYMTEIYAKQVTELYNSQIMSKSPALTRAKVRKIA